MIPLVNLKAQHDAIRPELDAALAHVLDTSQFVLGSEVAAFEKEFAAYCGAEHAVGVSTGTSALHLAMLAAGIGPGDDVVTVPFTFAASVAAIEFAGARPVFVDIDPKTCCIDVDRIEAAVTPRTKAILPVHLYGQPADMDSILAIARRRGLIVIEDAAQAVGAEYRGRRAGSLGHLACFSFYPSKNLGACGEGGAVTTGDAGYARRLRMLRNWGQETKYEHLIRGNNLRLQGFQGAILRVKLRYLEDWTEARRRHAARYDALLTGAGISVPYVRPEVRHVYHLYTVRVAERDAVRAELRQRGVETGVHYPIPVHLQPAYADLGYGPGDFPESERAGREVLSLPMFAELSDDQIRTVVDELLRLAPPAASLQDQNHRR
jgi:dTDP-4-amino-4,6-dideoxygalactose transaminase